MSQTPVDDRCCPTDGQLLSQFLARRSQEAFAALVRRHTGMVLRVCRARAGADAEDAAQAVFLTLAMKAGSLTGAITVAGWLYRVAWYIAGRSAEAAAIRRRHEQEAARMRSEQTHLDLSAVPEAALHAALAALPEKYRLPLILHHLEGRTEDETAALLGLSVSATSSRLSRAREKLRVRLSRGGAAVTAGAVAAVLAGEAAATSLTTPAALMSSIGQIAASCAGASTATTAVSASAAALAQGAMHMLFMAKMKLAAMVTAAVLLVGGVGVGTYLAAADGATAPKADTAGSPATGVGLALPAATKPAAPGLTLALYSDGRSFPDGKIWKLGAQGMGRPFAVRLILTNEGKDALRIWDPNGSEGSTSLGFVLTDATGRETILRTPAKGRLTGIPTVWKFGGSDAPYHERARDITVEMLRVIGERSLPPGKYRIRAFMQNAVENDGAFIKEPVWTGRIESEPTEIEISDKPATQPAAVDEVRALELARGAAEEALKGSYAAHVAAVKARGHVSPEHPDPWLSNVAPRVVQIGNGWRFEWQRTPMAGFGCQAIVEVMATGHVQVQVAKAWFSGK